MELLQLPLNKEEKDDTTPTSQANKDRWYSLCNFFSKKRDIVLITLDDM